MKEELNLIATSEPMSKYFCPWRQQKQKSAEQKGQNSSKKQEKKSTNTNVRVIEAKTMNTSIADKREVRVSHPTTDTTQALATQLFSFGLISSIWLTSQPVNGS